MSDDSDRHSQAAEPELVQDENRKAELEAYNQLRQFDEVTEQIDYWLHPERPFRLRPSSILGLNRIALEGLSSFAGSYRPAGIEIGGSKHQPPPAFDVPSLLEDLCEYVNANWRSASPVHLAAYILWRLNWIHPFVDGNGRTSRAVSYLVLSVRLGYRLPGARTIPEQISEDKRPYYTALEDADREWAGGKVDLSSLETLIYSLLTNQLATVLKSASAPGAEPGDQAGESA
ncbi:MAG: Fic family protein [Bryobacterales bacterium]|nr:Fic family protein [Bryobacterales bacterium]